MILLFTKSCLQYYNSYNYSNDYVLTNTAAISEKDRNIEITTYMPCTVLQ